MINVSVLCDESVPRNLDFKMRSTSIPHPQQLHRMTVYNHFRRGGKTILNLKNIVETFENIYGY